MISYWIEPKSPFHSLYVDTIALNKTSRVCPFYVLKWTTWWNFIILFTLTSYFFAFVLERSSIRITIKTLGIHNTVSSMVCFSAHNLEMTHLDFLPVCFAWQLFQRILVGFSTESHRIFNCIYFFVFACSKMFMKSASHLVLLFVYAFACTAIGRFKSFDFVHKTSICILESSTSTTTNWQSPRVFWMFTIHVNVSSHLTLVLCVICADASLF